MEERKKDISKISHKIIVDERENIHISGVSDVESFDEEEIILYTSEGVLILTGADFKINRLNVETGDIEICGFLNNLKYRDGQKLNGGGFWSKILK